MSNKFLWTKSESTKENGAISDEIFFFAIVVVCFITWKFQRINSISLMMRKQIIGNAV